VPDFKLTHVLTDPDGNRLTDDDRFADTTLSVTSGEVFHVKQTVADAYGNDVLWEDGAGGFDSFEVGLILSDQDIAVELRNDNGTADAVLVFVEANVPFYFRPELGAVAGSEAIDGSDLVDDTDYHTVDQIAVQRNAADGEGDAAVELWLLK